MSAWALAVTVVASLVIVSAIAPLAAAAGGTTVSIASADDSIEIGETTTVEVVVNDVDGGAGAAEFRVSLADASIARITDVTVPGAGQTKKTVADDSSWIDVEYAFANTADTGSVVVAEVTIEGVSAGTTDIALGSAAGNDGPVVYDEGGLGYSVTGTNGVQLSVEDDESVGGSESSGSADSDQTVPDDGDTDGSDGDGADSSGSSDSSGDASLSESGDASAEDVPSESEGASSDDATEPTPERANDVGASTTFGTGLDATTLDRVAGAVGGPIGAAVGAVVVLLLGFGLYRRR